MASVADETTSGNETSRTGESATAEGTEVRKRRRRRPSAKAVAHGAKVGSDAVRSRIAAVVRIVTVLCAVVVALGAILVALHDVVSQNNSVVEWVTARADDLSNWLFNFGGPRGGIFDFEKKNGNPDQVKNALANWGIVAVLYLVVGRVLDRIIRP